jgi:ABC-2 type transport system ATP-binding protein
MPIPAIQTRALGKVYQSKGGPVIAVEGLDLEIAPGQIFGLLGPNGAGKTTTIRMICGLIRPTTGEAFVEGVSVARDPMAVRRRIGLVPGEAGDHRNLTVREELQYYGAFYGLDSSVVRQRSEPLLKRLDLGDCGDRLLRTLSQGTRRKFHLVRALLHQPSVLLLDEPTSGLDPAVVEEVWDLLKNLTAQQNTTVVLCSHHLEEVERLCQRVAIIKQRLLVEGPLAQLSGEACLYRVEVASDPEGAREALASLPAVQSLAVAGRTLRFTLSGDPQREVPSVVSRLVERGAAVVEVTSEGHDLRSLYRSIIQEQPTAASQERL